MKIALIGDIGLFGKFDLGKNKQAPDYFEEVSAFLNNYDYVVGNLETPFTLKNSSFVFKSARLKSNPVSIELLKHLNIKALNLANNHIFDYGIGAYKSTIESLKVNGIEFFGTNDKQLYLEDEKLVFSGFCCYSTNGAYYYSQNKKNGVNVLDGSSLKNNLIKNFDNGYFNITSIHFGDEHIHLPRLEHVKLARDISESVPYVLYGHHPHVIQGIEKINSSLLAYSLGNFCFDDVYTSNTKIPIIKQSEANKESFILELTIVSGKIKDHQIIPIKDTSSQIEINPRNNTIKEQLNKYSKFLNLPINEYQELRTQKLRKLKEEKRKKKTLVWYINRLNLNMIGTKMKGKYFKQKYKQSMKKYLD